MAKRLALPSAGERAVSVTSSFGADAIPAGIEPAQEPAAEGSRALPIGLGFTSSPSTVLLGASADFPVDEHLTAGPALQLGLDDDRLLFAPHAQMRYWFAFGKKSCSPPIL